MDVLKSFSNNLNIWIISRLTLLYFLLGLGQIFLVFAMPSNMGLYPGHFEYYVMNHWVILNPLEKVVFFPLFLSVLLAVQKPLQRAPLMLLQRKNTNCEASLEEGCGSQS